MLIAILPRGELLILGILFAVIKVLVIVGLTFVFVTLFLTNWREARSGVSLFSFAFCFGTLGYLIMLGFYAIIYGYYWPSPFILMVLFLVGTALAFNRLELINPILDAMLLGGSLALAGIALIGGLQLVYTTGSFLGHLKNWILACGGMAVLGSIRNYVAGR